MNSKTYLTVVEAASILRVQPDEVRGRCRSGEMKASKPGLSWLIHEDDLKAYIEAHSNQRESA